MEVSGTNKNIKIGILIGVLILSAFLYRAIGYCTPRTNFNQLIGLVALLFGGYVYIFKNFKTFSSFKVWLGIAILFRLIFVFNVPNLSDDYPRFIWDGEMIAQGESPFGYTPAQYDSIQGDLEVIPNQKKLLHEMNSPDYFSIYPPVLQSIFTVSARLSGGDIKMAILLMKLVMLASEIASLLFLFAILKFLKQPKERWLLYAFNPLIIIELVGNLHFEGVMIPFLLGAIYYILKKQLHISAVFMALAVGAKLLPLMFLPLILNKLGFKKGMKYSIIVGVLTVLMFIPFINIDLIENFSKSLDLYFQRFEFNASIYYILRWLGFQAEGHNLIKILGVASSITSLALILFISFKKLKTEVNFTHRMLLLFSTYFFFATIVHPWYVSGLVAIAAIGNFRYPMLWSGLIFLSYYTYRDTTYTENLYFVALEYVLVFGLLFWELYKNKKTVMIVK